MSEVKLDTLTPLAAPGGTTITALGSVTSTIGLDAIKIPMSTLRNADGSDAMAGLETAAEATGSISDAAWSGSGNATLVSTQKAIYGKLNGTLTTNGLTDTELRATPVNANSYEVRKIVSTLNSSPTQIPPFSYFTGVIESTQNQSSVQINVRSDWAFTVYVDEYDSIFNLVSSTRLIVTELNQSKNYVVGLSAPNFRIRVFNDSYVFTATFNLETTLTQLLPLPKILSSTGALPVALNENNCGLATYDQVQGVFKQLSMMNIFLSQLMDGGKTNLNNLFYDNTLAPY